MKWPMVRLGDLGSFFGGHTPSTKEPKFWNGTIPWVSSQEVKVDELFDTERKLTKAGAADLVLFDAGTLLMVMRSGVLAHTFPISIARTVCTVNQDIKAMKVGKRITSEYLFWFLRGAEREILKNYMSKGATVQSIKFESFVDMLIGVPPLPEQKRIVAELEKKMAAADRLVASFAAMADQARALFRSTLSETFARIKADKVRLGDVCEIYRGGSPRPIKSFLTSKPDGVNWIKIGDVAPDGKYIEKTEDNILESGRRHSRSVEEGDFLLSNSMSFGRPYILKIDGCIHDGWLVIKKYQGKFDVDFFYYLLRSPLIQAQFNILAKGSTVRNLNSETVAMLMVPLPPLPEQRRIVAELDAAKARCEAVEAKAREGLAGAERLRKAILKEAFE